MIPFLIVAVTMLGQQPRLGFTQNESPAVTAQRGTDSLPVAVKLPNTGKSEGETAEEAKRVQAELNDAQATLLWIKVTGLATGVLAIATAFLWVATWRLASDARASSERQLRAYVSIRDFQLHEVPDPGAMRGISHWDIVARFENTGMTPARQVRTHANMILLRGDLPVDFAFRDVMPATRETRGVTTVGPSCQSLSGEVPFRLGDAMALDYYPAMRAYTWGHIEYRDVFANTPVRRTGFALEIRLTGKPLAMGTGAITLDHLDRHNDAT